jgi:hypothetical protein
MTSCNDFGTKTVAENCHHFPCLRVGVHSIPRPRFPSRFPPTMILWKIDRAREAVSSLLNLRAGGLSAMLKQLLDSPWTGAVIVLLSFVWEGFWLIGPPLGSDRKTYLLWGLVALMVSAAQAFFVLTRENRGLKATLDEKREGSVREATRADRPIRTRSL